MRNGQNKRMRGRNRKGQNPLTRVYESNGPDVKIRGTASHVADKYVQLARDAQTSGDPVAAENYFQHAEHYYRLIAVAQEQFRQANPYYRPENEPRDDGRDDGDDGPRTRASSSRAWVPSRRSAPANSRICRARRSRSRRAISRPMAAASSRPMAAAKAAPYGGRPQPAPRTEEGGEVDRLPSFITGGGGRTAPQGEPLIRAHRQPNGFEGGRPTASRCIAAGAAIAGRAATSRAVRSTWEARAPTSRTPPSQGRCPPKQDRAAPPGEGASTGSSSGTRCRRSRRAGTAR